MTASATSARQIPDDVEISRFAHFMSKLLQAPEVRQEQVRRVQSKIAAGAYETPDKLDAAVAALLADLA